MAAFHSVAGIFRDGKVELLETPPAVNNTKVIVTFLPEESASRGDLTLSAAELAELRWKLASWQEDWNASGMEDYDAF